MARILTITSWYPPHHFGGYELSCFDVMTRLVARGHEVRVLCGDERVAGAVPADRGHEACVHRELRPHLREASRRKPPLRDLVAIERANQRTLDRHLREFRPDVVSVWHMVAISMTLLRHVTAADVPVLYAVCDEWPRYGPGGDPWTARFEGGVIRPAVGRAVEALTGLATHAGAFGDHGTFCFVSDATRRRLERDTTWTFPHSTVVGSGIETAAFHPGNERPFSRGDAVHLLYVGRFEAWKGIDTLLRALALLPDATLECYGRGAHGERQRLEQLAHELGVSTRVSFGSLERSELGDRYRAADVVVFPSEWHEPFGLVPLEAMACGTPVVATGVGGSAEFLRDGANCVLFAAGDATALAAAVGRVRDDPELRCRIIAGGLRTAAALDVDRLAEVFDAWHVATASRFASGRPPARRAVLRATEAPNALQTFCAALLDDHCRTVLVCGAGDARVETAAGTFAVRAEATRLPFRRGAFDGIVAIEHLERARDDRVAVAELARTCAPGATVVAAGPSPRPLGGLRARLRDRIRGLHRPDRAYLAGRGFARELTPDGRAERLGAGFRILARTSTGNAHVVVGLRPDVVAQGFVSPRSGNDTPVRQGRGAGNARAHALSSRASW